MEEELGAWNLEIEIPDLNARIVAPHFGIGRSQDLSAKTVAAHFWIGTKEFWIGTLEVSDWNLELEDPGQGEEEKRSPQGVANQKHCYWKKKEATKRSEARKERPVKGAALGRGFERIRPGKGHNVEISRL